MPLQNPETLINQTRRIVESDKRSEIRLNANGGNSILIVCDPDREWEFIQAIQTMFDEITYQIIDVNDLLIQFVEGNKELLVDSFELLKGSVNQIFKVPEGEIGHDLYGCIMRAIENCFSQNKIPVMIHTGALYGSGIDNIHIMENDLVMKSSLPLIILYPATRDGDKLFFLSKRPASRYRCMIIN